MDALHLENHILTVAFVVSFKFVQRMSTIPIVALIRLNWFQKKRALNLLHPQMQTFERNRREKQKKY